MHTPPVMVSNRSRWHHHSPHLVRLRPPRPSYRHPGLAALRVPSRPPGAIVRLYVDDPREQRTPGVSNGRAILLPRQPVWLPSPLIIFSSSLCSLCGNSWTSRPLFSLWPSAFPCCESQSATGCPKAAHFRPPTGPHPHDSGTYYGLPVIL